MKIKVTVTLDVDAQKWANEFGIETEDVREDVKIYFADTCYEQLHALGLQAKKPVASSFCDNRLMEALEASQDAPQVMTRDDIIRAVQDYCADVEERGLQGRKWNEQDARHVAALFNRDEDPVGLFRLMDERTGDWRIGYRTKDGREYFHILRQMRNSRGSGLLENIGRK